MGGYDKERHLHVRSAVGTTFEPDGERLASLLDTTGTPQVWPLDAAESWPHQLTFSDERVTFADWSPAPDERAFGMDGGGVGRDLLVRLAGDGSAGAPLTDRPDAKHRWDGWSHDGDRFAFASNRRDEAVFDGYVQDRDGDALSLARLAVETGELATVEAGGDWNVGGLVLDDDTGRFAFSRNVDGYSELTVGELTGETASRTLASPDLPRGVVGAGDFDPGADRLAVTVTAQTTNATVYVVEVATGAATRWTDADTAGIPRSSFAAPRLVRYETFDGRGIPAFYTEPARTTDGGTSVIVDIHGGPESQRRPSFSPVTQ